MSKTGCHKLKMPLSMALLDYHGGIVSISFKGVGLALLVLLFSDCASLEEPRWVLLDDTQEKGPGQ